MSTEGASKKEVFLVNWELKSAARVDRSVKTTARPSKLHRALEQLQAKLREQQRSDPAFSQSHIFNFCAPLFVFLCVFILGVLVPRHPLVAEVSDAGGKKAELFAALALFAASILGGLLVLRGAIWVMARLATSFCEMDLSEPGGARVVNARGEEVALTQASLIVGGMLS